ncbi:MAG: efflux RND transporter periplasmic adaptor subunit [Clostridia bacterium]|nr:efflux RND transporter periplasmic adaptor subunit [Clostridia bacterium]
MENSETISNTEGVTTIKELYVKAGQTVSKGDTLIMLGTGKIFEASINGTVNEMRFKKGDYVWPNLSLVQICDLEHLEIQIQVDEYDVKKVEVGQKCYVTVVPLSMEFETVITHVNRMSASNGRVAYYPVTAKLEAPDSVLPGMTVSVRIADETAENVLVLPLSALSFDKEGNPFVYGKDGDNMKEISVETGLSDGMQIEIKSGVSEGDQVYAPSIGQEEETMGILTQMIRKIFGTRNVFNEERAARGNRGNAGGFSGQMPSGQMPDGQMPDGQMPQIADGEMPELFQQGDRPGAESTPAEASRESDGTVHTENPDLSGQVGTGDSGEGGQRRPRSVETSESSDGSQATGNMPGAGRSGNREGQMPEGGFPRRSGSDSGQSEGSEESAQ